MFLRLLSILLLALLVTTGCNQDNFDAEEQAAKDRQIIEQYAADNNLNGEFTPEGVYFEITKAGSGTSTPTINSRVAVVYEGKFLDGRVFDDSGGFPYTNPDGTNPRITQFIPGWQIGLQKFPRSSQGYLIIPSGLAYGNIGNASIPPNTVLRFDITMVDFN